MVLRTNQMGRWQQAGKSQRAPWFKAWTPNKATSAMPRIARVGKGSVLVWNMFALSALLLPCPPVPVLTHSISQHLTSLQ